MFAWTHTLYLLWVLALLVPRVGLAMPGEADASPDCPGHGQVADSGHLGSAPHGQARESGDHHLGDQGCSVDCLLSCGLAGFHAGIPMAPPQSELHPDVHPMAHLNASELSKRPGSLFRPPRA